MIPSILGGGEVIADALVAGIVGTDAGEYTESCVDVGFVKLIFLNIYPPMLISKIATAKIAIKIFSFDFEGELVGWDNGLG